MLQNLFFWRVAGSPVEEPSRGCLVAELVAEAGEAVGSDSRRGCPSRSRNRAPRGSRKDGSSRVWASEARARSLEQRTNEANGEAGGRLEDNAEFAGAAVAVGRRPLEAACSAVEGLWRPLPGDRRRARSRERRGSAECLWNVFRIEALRPRQKAGRAEGRSEAGAEGSRRVLRWS